MKIFVFTLMTVTFVVTNAIDICDPDSNGEPDCSANIVGQKFRNFWDPVHYWVCVNADDAAESVRCPTGTMYSEADNQCVSWRVWNWTNPCPEVEVELPASSEAPELTAIPEEPEAPEEPESNETEE